MFPLKMKVLRQYEIVEERNSYEMKITENCK